MDPLAHTLVGASLSETGLRRASPLATATLIAGANIPDVDALVSVLGRDTSLYFRRGHTHGVVAMVVLPILLASIVVAYDRLWRRRKRPDAEPARFTPILGLAFLSTLTHPALDWMNTYGVRLLMPFDGTWFYGDALFIIDPWIWLLTAAAVVLARSSGKFSVAAWVVLACATSSLISFSDYASWPPKLAWFVGVAAIAGLRLRGASEARVRRTAMICVAVLAAYIAAMVSGTAVARDQAERWLERRGHAPIAVMAGPLPANPFVRDVIATTPDGYRFLRVDWLAGPQIHESHDPLPGDERDVVIEAALAAPSVRGMANWMRFPSYEVEELADGWRVTINDVRYSRFDAPIGRAVVELDRELRPK